MIPEEAFDEAPRGKKNLRVDLVVQPSGPDPWRTREEYIQDRASAADAELRAIDAHRAALWVGKWTVIAAWVSVIALIATIVTTGIQVRQLFRELRELDRQRLLLQTPRPQKSTVVPAPRADLTPPSGDPLTLPSATPAAPNDTQTPRR
jgi:hypothetical protein